MKEFDVTITETLMKTVTVQADTREEAWQLVNDRWQNSEYVLSAEDYTDVFISAGEGRAIDRKLEVLLVEPGQPAEITTIGGDLKSMQEVVGGSIEAAYFFDDPVAIVCNEEGKILGLPLNRAIKNNNGDTMDIMAGTFFVCGLGEENFVSLPKELQKKYLDKLQTPETFLRM